MHRDMNLTETLMLESGALDLGELLAEYLLRLGLDLRLLAFHSGCENFDAEAASVINMIVEEYELRAPENM